MKKILLLLIIGIFLISFVGACQETNNFETNRDFMICTGDCLIQNFSNFSHYDDCDNSVLGYLTLSYENGSIIFLNQQMTRVLNQYQFNASSYVNISESKVYNAQCNFKAPKGDDDPVDFLVSISSVVSTPEGATGNPVDPQWVFEQGIEGYKQEAEEKLLNTLKKYGLWIGLGFLILFIMVLSLKKGKEDRLIDKILKKTKPKNKERDKMFMHKLNKKADKDREYVDY